MSRPINLVLVAGGAAAAVGAAWAAPSPAAPTESGAVVSHVYACGTREVRASFDGERGWAALDGRVHGLRRAADGVYAGDDLELADYGGYVVLKRPGSVELCLH